MTNSQNGLDKWVLPSRLPSVPSVLSVPSVPKGPSVPSVPKVPSVLCAPRGQFEWEVLPMGLCNAPSAF